jgi:hypothetical protein
MRRHLTVREWTIAAEAFLALPCVAVLLRLMSLRRAARWIVIAPAGSAGAGVEPVRVAQLVAGVAGWLQCRCLTQAFVTSRILALQGVRGEVLIGTARVDGLLRAHAWVEVDGRPIDVGDVSSYKPIYKVEPPGAANRRAA